MRLVLYLFFIFVGLFGFLLVIYFLDNPVDKAFYRAVFPYILSIKPLHVSQHSITEISISSFSNGIASEDVNMVVVDPSGTRFVSSVKFPGILRFPIDFNGSNTQLIGNYSVSIMDNSNKLLISGYFQVLVSPSFSSFNNFIFGSGLPITIGVIGTIITIVYQIMSQHNQDRGRRLDERAKWMLENSKYYFTLAGDSTALYSSLTPEGTVKTSSKDILFYSTRFYYDYQKFKENCGFYYFDDHKTENFLSQLDGKIFKQMDSMTGDYSELKLFFDLKTQSEFTNHSSYMTILKNTEKWLSNKNNVKDLYLTHILHQKVLTLSINRALLVTYGSDSKIKDSINLDIKSKAHILNPQIEKLNKEFYDNPCLYFSLLNSKGEVIW